MKTLPRITAWLTVLAIGFSVFTLLAADTSTVSDLAGQWQGKSRFTGISYAEASQKKVAAQDVEIGLKFAADGKVTGRVGGAELTGRVREEHRGWFWHLIHANDNFWIEGQITGAVVVGSEGGIHPINAPFIFDGTRIKGSLFVVYPIKYPYPFLGMRLGR
jgi:hypothetical protein